MIPSYVHRARQEELLRVPKQGAKTDCQEQSILREFYRAWELEHAQT